MRISENYDDEIEQLNTQSGLLPPQECAVPAMSTKDTSVLTKAGTLNKTLKIATMNCQKPPR